MRRVAFSLEALLEAHIGRSPRTIRDLREFIETRNPKAVPRIERALQRLRQRKRVQLLGRLWANPRVCACIACKGRGWTVGAPPGELVCAACDGAGWIKSGTAAEDPANVDKSK